MKVEWGGSRVTPLVKDYSVRLGAILEASGTTGIASGVEWQGKKQLGVK